MCWLFFLFLSWIKGVEKLTSVSGELCCTGHLFEGGQWAILASGDIYNLKSVTKYVKSVRAPHPGDGAPVPIVESVERLQKGGEKTPNPGGRPNLCQPCEGRFEDLTETIFAGHHQALRVWILCLYFMGLNLSNHQIAQELDLNKDDAQQMTSQLRQGIVRKKPSPTLTDEVECDEVYIVAGHKGSPIRWKKKGGAAGADDSKGKRGRGTLATEKPPIFGMIQRGGEVVIRMLENVQQRTIKPLIKATIAPGTCIYTDEYDIYGRLEQWGYAHPPPQYRKSHPVPIAWSADHC